MKKHVTIKYPGDRFVNVHMYGESDMEILEMVFAGFNHGSGQEYEIFLNSKMRSLSVNDLVQVGSQWYQCQSFGWKEITEEEVAELELAVIRHPSYEEHGAWFALSEIMWNRKVKQSSDVCLA